MKKIKVIVIMFCLMLTTNAFAGGWDFYFFGVNTKTFKEANYPMVALGVLASVAVHTGGHYAYAGLNGMSIRQDGFSEIVAAGYTPKEYREFAQAGFVAQHLVGLILTTVPYTRQTDFTKGYVGYAFFSTMTYPLVWKENGDFHFSNKYGGNRDWEYAAYMAVATHNMLRIKWYKEDEVK